MPALTPDFDNPLSTAMPITWFLQGNYHSFSPEDINVLTAAYDDALRASGVTDGADPIANTIAKRIIDLARLGERDPVRLREYALEFRQPPVPLSSVPTRGAFRVPNAGPRAGTLLPDVS